jgi:uncharacterized protein YprB with RNaseH-like and TPR domain
MQVEVEDFLRWVEAAKRIAFFDIETNNLNADYGEVLVFACAMDPDAKPFNITVPKGGSDKKLIKDIAEVLNTADCWVSYNGKRFDVPFINTRALEYSFLPLVKKPHVDLYFTLKHQLRLGRKALGTIGNWLQLEEDKMSIPPKAWRDKDIPLLVKRCESDVMLLQQLYKRTNHLIRDIRR